MRNERNKVSFVAKLTAAQAREICRLSLRGATQRSLAERFNVSQSTISNVVTRKVYRRNTAAGNG